MTGAPGPQDDVQRWVILVCNSLGLPVDDAGRDFFEAGGTSLTALKLMTRAEERYGEDALPPDDLFAESTIRQIAACIRRNRRLSGDVEREG